jgi:hypothetical protein
MILRPYVRYVLLFLGIASLLSAMWGGLVRLGIDIPLPEPQLAAFHGPLMVSGFLGTLISLERAVGIGRAWAYLAPVSTGLGALMLIAGAPSEPGALLMCMGSFALLVVFIVIIRQQTALFTTAMGMGALLWLIGDVLWLAGFPVSMVVFFWAGFLVLMIAGERLELARIVGLPVTVKRAFVAAITIYIAGLALNALGYGEGVRILGLGMIAVMLWLVWYDIAWRTTGSQGFPRFMAVSLLSGYAWLGIAGAIALSAAVPPAGPVYDAFLHALFLGFVFSMIFAHAPVIFSAVLGLPLSYKPRFYAHLALLHLSLLLRVWGDLSGWMDGRRAGALLNVLAVLLFLANTAYSICASRAKAKDVV